MKEEKCSDNQTSDRSDIVRLGEQGMESKGDNEDKGRMKETHEVICDESKDEQRESSSAAEIVTDTGFPHQNIVGK